MNAPHPPRRKPPPRRMALWALIPLALLAGHVTLMVVAMTLATGKNGPVIDPAYYDENKPLARQPATPVKPLERQRRSQRRARRPRGSASTRRDTERLRLDPEPFCIDAEPRCVDTEPLGIDTESRCIDTEPLCIDPESLCIDAKSLCIDAKSLRVAGMGRHLDGYRPLRSGQPYQGPFSRTGSHAPRGRASRR